jgi:hypothetical protein
MATWSEVQTHVRSLYRLQSDAPQHFIIAWQVEEPAGKASPSLGGEPVVQGVHCQPLTAGEQTLLVLRAEIGSERAMSPMAALHHSARLVLGGLVLNGNHYVLRYTLPLSGLVPSDLSGLDYALHYLAREAAALRQKLAHQVGSPKANSGPFSSSD